MKTKRRKKVYQVGITAIVHTFGMNMRFNPHVHAMVTEGVLEATGPNKFEHINNVLTYPTVAVSAHLI